VAGHIIATPVCTTDQVGKSIGHPRVLERRRFENLVLPDKHKNMLRSLIAAHYEKAGFDDFIKGKGAGLVVNLFGPPGVGE
jgi:hypothetical protein